MNTNPASAMRPARRTIGSLTALLLVTGGIAGLAPAAVADPAPPQHWAAWYEDDATPPTGRPFRAPQNLVGSAIGAHDVVTAVTSNFPNSSHATENIDSLRDRDPDTKWYAGTGNAPSGQRPIYAIYTLAKPAAITGYELTSGNDAPERDPSDWQVLASNDPDALDDAEHASWTVVDERSGERFSERKQTATYDADGEQAYRYYQLRTTAIRGGSDNTRFQIADWTLLGSTEGETDTGVATSVASARGHEPLHGDWALSYSGDVATDGPARATVTLHDGVDVPIGEDTMLTYLINPADAQAAHAAVDIVYTDAEGHEGRVLSEDETRRDVGGAPISAIEHADVLQAGRWNHVAIDLSDLEGGVVTDVLLDVHTPDAPAGATLAGMVDNVTLSSAVLDATSTWQYSDDNTDPAAGLDERTAWTAADYDDSAWKQGSGGFGAIAPGSELGGGYPIDTPLRHYIDGESTPVVPAYFFRSSFTLEEQELASLRGLYGNIVFDDSATVYVNGQRVIGWGDAPIEENLDYQERAGRHDPLHRVFSIPDSLLREGENTIAVEIHQCNDTSSDAYFQLPSLVATSAYLPVGYTSDEIDKKYPSDTRPIGPDGGDYIVEMLDDFDYLLENEPDVLAPNEELELGAELVAMNDRGVYEVNAAADAEQQERALIDAHGSAYRTMADGLGPLSQAYGRALEKGELPRTAALLDGRIEATIGDHEPAKAAYGYKRPYVRLGFRSDGGRLYKVDSDGSYRGLAGNGSFPSGHTNHGYAQGTTLAALLPEVGPQLLARASEYANNRLVLGFHYPMDVMGSRMVGQRIAQQRWSDPEFRTFMLQAQAELRTVLAQECGTPTVAECVDREGAEEYLPEDEALAVYEDRLTYDFEPVRATDDALVVPEGAGDLLLTTFPDLTDDQRDQVLAATALDSGFALDPSADGEASWQRLNLAAAMAAEVIVDDDGRLVVNGTVVGEEPGDSDSDDDAGSDDGGDDTGDADASAGGDDTGDADASGGGGDTGDADASAGGDDTSEADASGEADGANGGDGTQAANGSDDAGAEHSAKAGGTADSSGADGVDAAADDATDASSGQPVEEPDDEDAGAGAPGASGEAAPLPSTGTAAAGLGLLALMLGALGAVVHRRAQRS